jgi:TolB-like protein/Flp pilus assembly protein TadD
MATVYLAQDLKHDRQVALKVLRPELAAALGPERFLREITTTANLRHPHILPLYDSGRTDGLLFYVMPYVEGESLRDRLTREKQLPIDEAVRLTREVADALGYAHGRGVIHRDIKPENILLERGHAVVADFGIARAVSTAGGDKLTQTGMAVGTPVYMSPEQSVGESDVDARSDLYALGCVLYEMLAGEPPYTGGSAQAIIAKRFREPVPRISTLRETVPPALEAALTRVLAKSPSDRFATAEEFTAALTAPAQAEAARPAGAEEFWVAVLPFKSSGASADLTALAEGLSEGIVTGLSRFSYLRVIARGSTLRYVSESTDARTVGKELGARYVMEGSLRQAGAVVRVSVQLADASTGAQLWAEMYDRGFSSEGIFELQDELVPRIVSTIADAHGVLPHTLSEALRSRNPDQLSPYEAVLRSFGYGYRMTPEEHATVRAILERAVRQAPGYADAWGMLSLVYTEEFSNGFNARPDPLGRALQAARRAADAAPSSALAYNALARALFFRKEFQAFRIAADRAIELNPVNGPTVAGLGGMMAYAGDWEHGCAQVERAVRLNPRHPGGYWFALFYNAYRQGDYRGALSVGLKINLPDFFATHVVLAAAYGQLGELDAAAGSLRELLRLKPDFVATMRDELGKWFNPDLVEHQIDGLRKAGLGIAPTSIAAAPSAPKGPTASPEGSARPGIAVLPFANMSADPADEFFADGITEEIINALAQLPGLRVAARTSCFAFKGKHEDLRAVADKLGVGTVMEGSVRKSGTRLRITAQLINAGDGCHLWSERYDRELSDVFAMQDEIAGAIAAKLQLALTGKPAPRAAPASAEAYQLLLKGRVLLNRRGRAILESRACLEQAVALDAGSAEAHALLGDCYRLHAMYGIAPPTEMMPRARASAEHALALDPEQVEALATLANIAATFDRDVAASAAFTDRALARDPAHVRALCERAIWLSLLDANPGGFEQALLDLRRARSIDPLNAWAAAMQAFCLSFAGRPEEAVVPAREAMELDPDNFTAHWTMVLTLAGLARHDEALAAAEPALLMSGRNPRILAEVAAVHAARGDTEAAEAVYQEVRGRARTGYIGWAEQAAVAAAAGHLVEARALVQKAFEARDLYLMFWKLAAWAPLRGDPESLKILRSTDR